MDEHNSNYPRVDWDAEDMPLAFKAFKNTVILCLEVS